jgi:hypothetical protein
MGYLYEACDQISDFCHQQLVRKMWGYNNHCQECVRAYLSMHIFRRIFLSNYWWQESDILSQASYRCAILWEAFLDPSDSYFLFADLVCWEKCDEKCAYMFNVYKNQLSRQTGSRNLMGPKTLPTIWYTYMMLNSNSSRRLPESGQQKRCG